MSIYYNNSVDYMGYVYSIMTYYTTSTKIISLTLNVGDKLYEMWSLKISFW